MRCCSDEARDRVLGVAAIDKSHGDVDGANLPARVGDAE
jgi:hypothetical protein